MILSSIARDVNLDVKVAGASTCLFALVDMLELNMGK